MAGRFAVDGFLGQTDGQLLAVTPDDEVVGSVGWRAAEWGTPPHSRAWDIGATMLPQWRGRGLGSQAQRLLVDYLFGTTAVNRIQASTDVTNLAEQGALARAGFTREGVVRGAQFRDGGWHDLVLYGLLRGDGGPAPG